LKKLKTVYDYVIVGGGSAGSALANRLSANPNNKVLVLEAGRPDYWWDVFIHMPAALTFPIGSRFYDWLYVSEPEPNMNNRRVTQGRGKVLGGSSSINGMIFQRGNPLDYQRWASDPGMGTWDYAHCLPYFKRLENCLAADPDDQFRGHDGPLQQERGPIKNPLFSAFFKAVQQAGHELTTDVNGYKQEGFAAFDRNLRRGRRLSAARAYLHPVMHRKNLTVKCRALVTKLNIENKKVTGVNFELPFGRKRTVDAKEVVLCGGTFNSPQLLQVSGIGNSQHLKSVGVEPVHHLPGVGENLQDHLEVYVQHSCSQPVSLNPMLKLHYRPFIGLAWLFRRGPGASNHFEGGGFIRGNQSFKYPNLMFHFLPIAVRYDGTAPAGGHGYQVHIGPMYSSAFTMQTGPLREVLEAAKSPVGEDWAMVWTEEELLSERVEHVKSGWFGSVERQIFALDPFATGGSDMGASRMERSLIMPERPYQALAERNPAGFKDVRKFVVSAEGRVLSYR
jgi:choline dehydrogenase